MDQTGNIEHLQRTGSYELRTPGGGMIFIECDNGTTTIHGAEKSAGWSLRKLSDTPQHTQSTAVGAGRGSSG